MSDPAQAEQPGSDSPVSGFGEPPPVLLVEDEAHLREMIVEALEGRDIGVAEAAGDQEAYVRLEAEARSFKVLIASVNLGQGATGFAVARRARELNADLKIVYINGDAADLEKVGAPDSIMFPRPLHPEELADKVQALLGL